VEFLQNKPQIKQKKKLQTDQTKKPTRETLGLGFFVIRILFVKFLR